MKLLSRRSSFRFVVQAAVALTVLSACVRTPSLTTADSTSIAAEIERLVKDAYDLTKPGLSNRMISLYGDSGTVVSASAGEIVASRDSLERGIRFFWDNVGMNMRDPRWLWDAFHVDVLSPTSAVATTSYRIQHHTPANVPHELAGAMTFVFQRRGDRWVVVQEHLSDKPERHSFTTP